MLDQMKYVIWKVNYKSMFSELKYFFVIYFKNY